MIEPWEDFDILASQSPKSPAWHVVLRPSSSYCPLNWIVSRLFRRPFSGLFRAKKCPSTWKKISKRSEKSWVS